MNKVDMLNQIKTLLGVEATEKVELAQMTLDNGTVIEAEVFEANNEVFIITEEEKIALPVGEYTLEDGRTIMVEEEGIIKEIKATESEESEEVEAAEEEEMAYVTREEFGKAIDEIKAMIDGLGKKEEEMAEEVNMSAQEPATEPLKHNPEEQIVQKFRKLSHNKKGTTTDLIFSKLFNK
jgi:phenylalanyl-tRNA synthetase alpha subunit